MHILINVLTNEIVTDNLLQLETIFRAICVISCNVIGLRVHDFWDDSKMPLLLKELQKQCNEWVDSKDSLESATVEIDPNNPDGPYYQFNLRLTIKPPFLLKFSEIEDDYKYAERICEAYKNYVDDRFTNDESSTSQEFDWMLQLRSFVHRDQDTTSDNFHPEIKIQRSNKMDTVQKLYSNQEMIDNFRSIVYEYAKEHLDVTDNVKFTIDDVYVVWQVKVLQNWKALLSTNLPDGMYYECTYNGDKNEIYLDAYKKFENCVTPLDTGI